nr:unnamed protein product [Callosobruchus chinensis]
MFIIDVQGFNYGSNTFICKEIAIINIKTGVYSSKAYEMVIIQLPWIGMEHHKDHFYEQLSDFIKNVVKNEIVFVKGVDKKVWLERFTKIKS